MRLAFVMVICVAMLIGVPVTLAQPSRFIPVEGPDLKSTMEQAISLARSTTPPIRFWTAYSFDVRPGVAVDAEWRVFHGSKKTFSGTTVFIGTSGGSTVETRNLGVFLLREPDGTVLVRVDVYNLDRRHEYSGYPVYWLGHSGNDESVTLLNDVVESNQGSLIIEHATMALALHDDPRVGPMLETMVRQSSLEKVRTTAVFWLGLVEGEHPFLAELVRNEHESLEMRKHAALAIGTSKDKAALTTLQRLYGSVTNREVRKTIIVAVSRNEQKDEVVTFLIKVANDDPDRDIQEHAVFAISQCLEEDSVPLLVNIAKTHPTLEVRKKAIFWLGQQAGHRSLEALGDVVNRTDEASAVQEHVVFAISQHPKEEAVPLLLDIAKTHPKVAVRKKAIFWLGQIGDDRALEFFKEILLK